MSLVKHLAGQSIAVFTTWGFVLFAVLLVVAVVGHHTAATRAHVVLTTVAGGFAAVVAAAGGLVVKHAVAEPRPCQVHPALAESTSCPAAGNWSFPSNHAVFAGALAVTVVVVARVVARPWIAAAAMVLALAIAHSRVLLGVHYWWDVLAGLAWGAGVAALLLATVAPGVRGLVVARGDRRRPTTTTPVG